MELKSCHQICKKTEYLTKTNNQEFVTVSVATSDPANIRDTHTSLIIRSSVINEQWLQYLIPRDPNTETPLVDVSHVM